MSVTVIISVVDVNLFFILSLFSGTGKLNAELPPKSLQNLSGGNYTDNMSNRLFISGTS